MKKKLKTLAMLIMCTVMFLMPSKAATADVTILKNGTPIVGDVNNYRVNGRSYVSIRAFFGDDCSMLWDSTTKTAIVSINDEVLSFTNGDLHFNLNGNVIRTDSEIAITAGRMFVPVRALANALSYEVFWEDKTKTVSFVKDESKGEQPTLPEVDTVLPPQNNNTVIPPLVENIPTTDEDKVEKPTDKYDKDSLYWLSRIICAESCIEPYQGKIAVGNVVLNRVKSPNYPNTVKGVVFDKRYAIQFEPVANGTVYNTPDDNCIKAAKECLDGKNVIGSCLYFLNPYTAVSTWIQNNCKYVMTIGGHDFYL